MVAIDHALTQKTPRHDVINVICDLDLSTSRENDPSTWNGWNLVYERDIPGEIRFKENDSENLNEIGVVEPLILKICIKGHESHPTAIRLEIISDSDLFLNYTCVIDESSFDKFSKNQNLLISMAELVPVLMKMANNCIKNSSNFLILVLLNADDTGTLSFIQNMEYKYVELLHLEINAAPEENVRQSILFRYSTTKAKLVSLHTRLQEVCLIVKKNHPELLKSISKPIFNGLSPALSKQYEL